MNVRSLTSLCSLARLPILAAGALLAACTTLPTAEPDAGLIQPSLFEPPSEPIDSRNVFALSEPMRRYIKTQFDPAEGRRVTPHLLFDALHGQDRLRLEYDSARTRTAAEAFDAGAGNCLSLVAMTGAFAKALGIDVQFESVLTDDAWSRDASGNVYVRSDHVTLTVGHTLGDGGRHMRAEPLRIDFLPAADSRELRTRVIPQTRVIAMYMNNRAAESLIVHRIDDAFWWARAAIEADPTFLNAYNTLGIVYRRHGNPALAEQAYDFVLGHEPDNSVALSNLSQLLRELGRTAEADEAHRRFLAIEQRPPFHFFELGRAAMRREDYAGAGALFRRALARDAFYHEFHFWLGLAEMMQGNDSAAKQEIMLALENSTTRADRELYKEALARLQRRLQPERIW